MTIPPMKPNTWEGYFALISVITLGFVIVGFAAADEPIQEFSKDVATILIPIIAGGIVTKFTTNSWQITKEKIEIKKDILTNYETSYKKISMLLENYMYQVIESYIIYKNNETSIRFESYDNNVHNIHAYLPKVISSDCLPSNKFKVEYQQLKDQIRQASLIQNKFFSNIRLHFGAKSLEKATKELEKLLNNQQDIVQRFMQSVDVEEIIKFYKVFEGTIKGLTDKFEEIEDAMVNLKFREVTS